MASVFVVDDHPIVAMAIRLALADASDLFFLGYSVRPEEALKTFVGSPPDVLVLDLVLTEKPDASFVGRCRGLCPRAVIVVFSSLSEPEWLDAALEAGADDIVSKTCDVDFLIERIRAIAASPSSTYPAVSDFCGRRFGAGSVIGTVQLTRRETEIAAKLSRGASVQAIASDLAISGKTVAAHRDNLRLKLRCRSTSELVAYLARSL